MQNSLIMIILWLMCGAATIAAAALRVPLARRRSGCAKGFQLLKSPTTETAPHGSSAGRAKVTRTVPSRPGLVVLINCSLRSGGQPHRAVSSSLWGLATHIAREQARRVDPTVCAGPVSSGRSRK